MQKIISLFQRNYEGDRLVRNEVVPGAEWVLAGEGVATRKYDGTCCMIRDGKLFKRCEVKAGKLPPLNFEAADDVDSITGKRQGWVPVGDGNEDRWHREAFATLLSHATTAPDGTYELLGPKIQGNPEKWDSHGLLAHADAAVLVHVPRDFEGLKASMEHFPHEGIVWHHPDGRMVKIKRRDFWN